MLNKKAQMTDDQKPLLKPQCRNMANMSWHDLRRSLIITTMKCRNYKRKSVFIILLGITILTLFGYLQTISSRYYVNQQPCRIPDLNPWDPSISNYIKQTESKCPELPPLMTVDHKGYLDFNQTSARHYGIKTKDLQCKYAVVQRNEDNDVIFEPEKEILLPFFIPGRFYRVQCKNKTGIIVYDFVHMNAEYLESSYGNIDTPEDNETYSFFFVGIDSASHSHVLRNLPLTYKYLTNDLHMYDFKGYMKVGMNSFPNLCPLLTGKSETEFPFYLNLMKMDSLPLLWKEKEFRSHMTLFVEDRPEIALFNYIKRGFVDQPTLYYFRPMSLAMAKFTPVIVSPLPEVTSECYGNLHQYDIVLEFYRRFLEKFRNKLRFAFFWNNQMSHESYTSLWQGDRPLLDFFHFLKYRGHLNNSILIVLSDHGYRLGGLSTTYVGRLENNLPFLSVYVPESLKRRFPWIHTNLMENSNRLVTVYDIHKTVSDISKKQFEYKTDGLVYSQRTARNLFHPIPKERTCVDAGVADNFCTCQESIKINPSHFKTALLGNYIVENINKLLEKFLISCHELKLSRVVDARVIYRSQEKELSVWEKFRHFLSPPEKDYTGRYTLTVETVPSFGLFEGVVVYEEFRESPDKGVEVAFAQQWIMADI
ncbi:hypothetical protein CHS0354_042351 [Potamilus streckersoni]|uniref:DUF229 domain containing protein n=1 Tax=Potamilus streckersoni TaxID=2493646 RepID=A0AAE0SUW9_9BIVA|nr:hypothetical protein CHS0354_042351 [Potamilus streckersoni]